MKTSVRIVALVFGILVLAGCDTGASPTAPAPSGQPAAEAPPAPPPFDPQYEEHMIRDDRYSTVMEFAYTSPIDGKRMICTNYGTGVGSGVSCRAS